MIASWLPEDKDLYLFDVDGVLIRVDEPFNVRYEREVNTPGMMVPFFRGVFQDCLVGKADLREEVAQRLDEWKWEGDVDSFLEHWFSREAVINHEILESINELRAAQKPCYLVTNQEKYRTEYLTKRLGLDSLVDGFYSSSMLGVKKPDPAFFTEVLKRIGFSGNLGTVFCVDNEMDNIASAKELGIDTFYYEA